MTFTEHAKIKVSNPSLGYFIINSIILLLFSTFFNNGGIFVIGLVGLVITIISASNLNYEYWNVLMACTFIAIVWLVFQYFGVIEKFGKPYYAGDDENYEFVGKIFYSRGVLWIKKVPDLGEAITKNSGYYWIIAWIRRLSAPLGGYSTISPRILNIYLWLSTCTLTCKYICIDDPSINEYVARKIWAALMIFPNALYISSFVYRDTLCVFLVILFVYNFRVLRDHKYEAAFFRVLVMVLACYLIFYTRSKLLLLVAGYVLTYFLLGNKNSYMWLKRIILVMFFLVAGVFAIRGEIGDYISAYTYYTLNAEGTGFASGLSNIVFRTPLLPFGFILRSIYGMMVPFPGEILQDIFIAYPIYSLMRFFIYLGTIFQIIFIPFLVKSFKRLEKNAIMWLLTYWMVILVTFTFRHFILVYPFLAVEIYYGIKDEDAAVIKSNILKMFLIIIAAGTLYLLMKLF